MKFSFPVFFVLAAVSLAGAQDFSEPMDPAGPSVAPRGAVAAMLAMPVRYNNGILQVFGKSGNPNPEQWKIIARDVDNMGDITAIIIAGGQVLSEEPSLNLGQMFRESGYINPPSVQVDSGDAYLTASSYAAANGHTLGGVDFTLIKKGEDVAPLWTLVCHDANGKTIGQMQILATNGVVISHRGFQKTP